MHAFLEARNIDKCYLAGNSLGGLIAWNYAAAHPNAVRRLILLDAAGYPVAEAPGALGFTLARIPILNQVLTLITPKFLVRKSLEDVYGNKTGVTEALVMQYHDMTCREGNRTALIARLNTNQSIDTTLVQRLQTPTLIIWGDQDQLIPVEHGHKFQRDLPQNELIVLEGVGHVPMEEKPEAVVKAVVSFLANNR